MAHHAPRRALFLRLLQVHQLVLLVCSFVHSSGGANVNNLTAAAVPSAPCLPDQAAALLRLKRSFVTTNYSVIAFRSWRAGTDCCRWVGVRCRDADGRVTSLDLADRGLESGGLDPALFDLTSLEYLNLAYNDFNGSQLPSRGFERLNKLSYLNLSSSHLCGQVPAGIGHLTNLVSLDLSSDLYILDLLGAGYDYKENNQLIEQNFTSLVANLHNLRQLLLGNMDLSNCETQWCDVLVTSCPKLQLLSLPYCGLSGPLCAPLSKLHSLSVIDLQSNLLSGPVPDFFTNLSDLSILQLAHNNLQGWISPAIFQLKKLVTIDLHRNYDICGYLPSFFTGSRLENLDVGRTNFSGIIPASISNLTSLKKLGLGASGFMGELPPSIGNLKSLSALDISGTGIVGFFPSWVANLTSLTSLRFYHCVLSGPLPYFIGGLRYLKELVLSDCGFSGEIPSSISNLTQLQILMLPFNNFNGTMELNLITKFPNLIVLDLSYNDLVVLDGEDNSSVTSSFPKMTDIFLGGCGMFKFPNFLRHQDQLVRLQLSDNKMHGVIPQWACEAFGNHLFYLDLSNNSFTSIGCGPFLPLQIEILDLSNNIFEGTIPIPQGPAIVLDYTNNLFSSVPAKFSSYLSNVSLFKASGNNLSGEIPSSFCDATNIQLLDLSYNNFNGSIPSCLMENANGMESLYLTKNQLHGEIPEGNKEGCSFKALDFSGNWIKGQLPRSLVACKNLEFLDVGNNQISDTFPCWMSKLHRLEVLVLKSNKFFGHVAQPLREEKSSCTFPSATIIDISSNSFFGPLPEDQWFKNLKSMVFRDPNMSPVMDHGLPNGVTTYKYTTAITYKGQDTTFAQILTSLVFIDFSNNALSGSVPAAIGELHLLHGLNISHNSLTGPIPSQLAHLNQLEALDLSSNALSGKIPQALAWLNFLTTLNLSNNKLVGRIPQSPHFLTFSNSSFIGNEGLCGPPLSKECINTTMSNVVLHHSKKSVDIMLFLFVGLGFGVGFAITICVTWGIPIRKQS